MVGISRITPAITLLDLEPLTSRLRRFLGAYVCRGDKTAIIDMGPTNTVPNLLAGLSILGIKPQEVDYIILTHIHIDHAGGTGTAVRELPNARVIVHSRGYQHLIDPTALWQASQKGLGSMAIEYGKIEPVPETRLVRAAEGMTVDLSKRMKLEIYLTPGHAPHHLSLFDRSDNILFAGEAAGVCLDGATRPSTPPPFRLAEEMASLDRLIALKPKRLAYCHLGCYDDGVPRLEAMKRQIMDWYRIVSAAKKSAATAEDIFPLIREKDPNVARLAPDEHARQYPLIINSIKGLMGNG